MDPSGIKEWHVITLIGIRGELLSCRGKNRFVLRIQQINTVYSVEVSADKLTALPVD